MRISTLLQHSLGYTFFAGILFSACGSYQNASYYSDGIYSSDNVIVVRRTKPQPKTNAYSRYFDEKAKQYTWNDTNDNVVLTDVDSLNQGNLKNYQTNANWGGGNKTTQIIIQTNPLPLAYGGVWGYGDFFNPYFNNWNFGYYNPYAWNRFGWGFNRPWRFNRWGWGFYDPFFSPFDPYFGNAFYFGNPYFYGGGYWNGYAYHNRFNRFGRDRWNNNAGGARSDRRVRSSSYRGQAGSGGQRGTVAQNRSASSRSNSAPTTSSNRRASLNQDEVVTVPDLVQEGRTASVRARENASASEGRANRQQAAEEARNRSQIDRVIRNLQNRGYNIQVINDAQGARAYQSQNSNGGVRSGNRSAAYSNNQKGTPSSRRSNTSSSNTSYSRSNANRSSSSGNSSNYRSSPSRSYSAPARASSGGSRSSSSGSSSGRSSGGRRQ